MKKLFFAAILSVVANSSFSYPFWKTVIQVGDTCKYFIPSDNLGFSWIVDDYNDLNWTKAASGIGFGNNDNNTTIADSLVEKGIYTVYLRYKFRITNKSDIKAILLDADFDDGFVAYLNGNEICRGNINAFVSWNMTLAEEHEAEMHNGKRPEQFTISEELSNSLLINGENILAIELHNATPQSIDMTGNFFLHALVYQNTNEFRSTPDWFLPPLNYTHFNLPLIKINTGNQVINRDSRITANLDILNYKDGNYIFDPANVYSGYIGIKIRGESSAELPKKSYSIELRNPDGSSNNVSILNLPSENDFILYAPFSDKTMLRNVLTYELFRQMGHWAPRTKFVELFLNNQYEGIYVLTEKIKRDKNRVNINKLSPKDTVNPGITGGYILRIDKTTGLSANEYWPSAVKFENFEQHSYQFYDPDYTVLANNQKTYIKNWLQDFDNAMIHNLGSPLNTIDTLSFANLFFLNELSKNIDSYLYSTYLYKTNDRFGGKLFVGPPWDYDLTYGNLNYRYDDNIPNTFDWLYDKSDRIFWWYRLMQDSIFKNYINCSWDKYRKKQLSDANIFHIIDSCINYLGPSIERNFVRYPILGLYVWPNEKYPETYTEEIINIKNWISERTMWLDSQLQNKCIQQETHSMLSEFLLQSEFVIFPNPSNFQHLQVKSNSENNKQFRIIISDIYGRIVFNMYSEQDNLVLPDLSFLAAGLYLYKIETDNRTLSGKIEKK